MAWIDVPKNLEMYDTLAYSDDSGGTTASSKLLAAYGVTDVADVPEDRREDFERDLGYRIAACQNLATSKAMRNLQ